MPDAVTGVADMEPIDMEAECADHLMCVVADEEPDFTSVSIQVNEFESRLKLNSSLAEPVSDSVALAAVCAADLTTTRREALPDFLQTRAEVWSSPSSALLAMGAMKERKAEHVRWRATCNVIKGLGAGRREAMHAQSGA